MLYQFTVPGAPRGKERPRFVKQGGKQFVYTPPKTAAYEKQVKAAYQGPHFSGAVGIRVMAYYPIPDSWPKHKKQEALACLIYPTVTPDLDNILKAVCDALNGAAYADDKAVVSARVDKCYSDRPRVCVEIWGEVGGIDPDRDDP